MQGPGSFRLLIASALGVATVVSASAQQPKPALPIQTRTFAVFERREGADVKPPAECLRGFVRRSHPLYDRYRLLILQSASPDPPSAESVGRCLGPEWMEAPFVYEKNALAVTTDEILLRFKPDVDASDITALLREQHLSTKDDKLEAGTVTARTHRPMSESADIAKKLQASGLVEYAEPNKLLVRFGG